MQKAIEKTDAMLLRTESDVFDVIIPADHPFRRLLELIDFSTIVEPLHSLYSDTGRPGVSVETGLKALLLQFWEDYSDRQMEKALRENIAVKLFCGLGLLTETPDHTYFTKLRERIGAKRLADIFNVVNEKLRSRGLFGDVFTFIDASALITKTALWEERDRAIAAGEEKLNNANVEKYAADKDARWGAKSKNKIWFGYKLHDAVDMRFGLIRNLAVTPANVPDFAVIDQICPCQGMVFADKLYDAKVVDLVLKAAGCAAGTIRKNTNKRKNRDLDRWRSGIRMPFEGTFSKIRKRVRYRGTVKVLFQSFAEAICHNLKKALAVLPASPVVRPVF